MQLQKIFICLVFALHTFTSFSQSKSFYKASNDDLLADETKFPFWEARQKYTKTYFVDNNNALANDSNKGTEELPFQTISRAAELLRPGERVIIKSGVYRESIHPARGGISTKQMITYQAAENEEVIVKGSIILETEKWEKGKGWRYGKRKQKNTPQVWQFTFDGKHFQGYNPFGMLNLMHDREYLEYTKVNMKPHFKRRGMVFLNGKPIEQVLDPIALEKKDSGAFWVEHHGMRIHVRFPGNTSPNDYLIEATVKEQIFVPREYGCGFIKIDGIKFQHVGNGFPVPQRGMVSTNRGHHWIIENCTIEWANSVGLDMGNEMWYTINQDTIGFHVIRNNIIRYCGISGLQAMRAITVLVEDNMFDSIGWRDAELGFESGGIKFHRAQNTLIRRNVFRNITYAPGIWLDYKSNRNCRITKNVFSDITTARGAIYIEASHNHCLVDHNVFHKLHSQYWISGTYGAGGNALYTDGSDSINFTDNLIFDIENTGYGAYLNAPRIVGRRGGITRWHSVVNNIFINCRKHAIEFANVHNFSDKNIFSKMRGGYLTIGNPKPPLLLDLPAWQKLYNWEENGKYSKIAVDFDNKQMQLTIKGNESELKKCTAGPFKNYHKLKNINIDPRKTIQTEHP